MNTWLLLLNGLQIGLTENDILEILKIVTTVNHNAIWNTNLEVRNLTNHAYEKKNQISGINTSIVELHFWNKDKGNLASLHLLYVLKCASVICTT